MRKLGSAKRATKTLQQTNQSRQLSGRCGHEHEFRLFSVVNFCYFYQKSHNIWCFILTAQLSELYNFIRIAGFGGLKKN